MTVNDLLLSLTRLFLISFAVITSVDFLRHGDHIRRDIALVFISVAANSAITLILAILGVQAPLLNKIGQIALIGQPYLLLRLVAYFRTVPRHMKWAALAGWVISSIIFIFFAAPLDLILALPVIYLFRRH